MKKSPKTPPVEKKVKGDAYYAVLCYCAGKKESKPIICGVLASKEEARALAGSIKDCPAKHQIKKCSITIVYTEAL